MASTSLQSSNTPREELPSLQAVHQLLQTLYYKTRPMSHSISARRAQAEGAYRRPLRQAQGSWNRATDRSLRAPGLGSPPAPPGLDQIELGQPTPPVNAPLQVALRTGAMATEL